MTTTKGGKSVYILRLPKRVCVNCGHVWTPRAGSDKCPKCKRKWAVRTRGLGWRKGVEGHHAGAGWPKGVRRGTAA